MPDFAYVIQEATCPHCSQIVTPMVAFQWGFCYGPDGPRDGDYRLGDTIRWKECAERSILAWTYFVCNGRHAGGNIGDPAYRDIITRATHYGLATIGRVNLIDANVLIVTKWLKALHLRYAMGR